MRLMRPAILTLAILAACAPLRTTEPETAWSLDRTPGRLTLRDGREVRLRGIRPDDAGGLQSAFAKVSERARYMRFMSPLKEIPSAMLEHAVNPSPESVLALVAVAGDEQAEVIVGGARFSIVGDGSCEFAITVAEDWKGVGLASRLMRELIRDARARGLQRMVGHVLTVNRPMLDLARHLGFTVGSSDEGPSVRHVQLDLR